MMPYSYLVDEIRGNGFMLALLTLICAMAFKLDINWTVYIMSFALIVIAIAGGTYFGQFAAENNFFRIWAISTLVISILIIMYVCEAIFSMTDPSYSYWTFGLAWGVIFAGAAWLIFVKKVERKVQHPDANAIGVFSAIGAIVFGGSFYALKSSLLFWSGFMVLAIYGFILALLCMSHVRGMLNSQDTHSKKQ